MFLKFSGTFSHLINVNNLLELLWMLVHFHVETVTISTLDLSDCKLYLFLVTTILLDVIIRLSLERCKVGKVPHSDNGESQQDLASASRQHRKELTIESLRVIFTIPNRSHDLYSEVEGVPHISPVVAIIYWALLSYLTKSDDLREIEKHEGVTKHKKCERTALDVLLQLEPFEAFKAAMVLLPVEIVAALVRHAVTPAELQSLPHDSPEEKIDLKHT
jgi:hypothetical protein